MEKRLVLIYNRTESRIQDWNMSYINMNVTLQDLLDCLKNTKMYNIHVPHTSMKKIQETKMN